MDATRAATVLDDILDFLVTTPTLQQITEFHISGATQLHVRDLLDRNREGTLSDKEKAEMEEISQLNHFFILLKARANQVLLKNDVHS